MVGVAQLVELLVVVQAVAGSIPVAHPSSKAPNSRQAGRPASAAAGKVAERDRRDRLYSGLESRPDHRGELGAVVCRDVIGDSAGLFGLAVGVRVGAADVITPIAPSERKPQPPE